MSYLYIDIGAQRIQTWISKPTKLKYVRGGSELLSNETGKKKIKEWLKTEGIESFQVADEAGDIDGVVVLKAKSTDDSETLAEQSDVVAHKLLLHLNQKIPGVEWSGWRCIAPTFIEAYQKAVVKGQPDREYRLQPSVTEFTGIKSCDGCKAEPVAVYDNETKEGLGKDCLARSEKLEVGQQTSFESLAKARGGYATAQLEMKGAGQERPRNHIATICADGNRVGALFQALSEDPRLEEFKLRAIKTLATYTDFAVETAIDEVRAPNGSNVVISHYIGGDDVLVSVTADEAWKYAVELIKVFEEIRDRYRGLLNDVVGLDDDAKKKIEELINAVSLGVGIVFSHHKYPFYDCRHKAEEALSRAKRETKGESSAICWMDLTEDGGDSLYTTAKHWIKYQVAKEQLEDPNKLPAIFHLNRTAQNNLQNQLTAWLQVKDAVTSDMRQDFVDKWITRTRRGDIKINEGNLESDLHRARWWPFRSENDNGEER